MATGDCADATAAVTQSVTAARSRRNGWWVIGSLASEDDGVLGGVHGVFAGVGVDQRLVRAGRQYAEREPLVEGRARVQQAARLFRLRLQLSLCVVDLDPELGAIRAFAGILDVRLDEGAAVRP